MQKHLLENVIRKFLFEKSEVKLRIEVPTSQDVEFFEKQIKKLITKKNEITVQTADVIRYEVIRIGGREETSDDQKISSYNESSLQTDILFALNRLTGTYGQKTNADYVWVIAFDPYNTEQNKQSKIRAKYVILASYISKSLLPAIKLDNTTSGFFGKTSKGAYVFNLEKINETEWKSKSKVIAGEPIQGGDAIESLSDLPITDLKFGNKNSNVNKLYSYFDINFPKIGIDNVREFKRTVGFGCELKSMIEQFQTEQNIPVTGDWDKLTRMKVFDLKKVEYEIQDINSLNQRISTCKIKNLDLNNIVYPASGAFTPENTKQPNEEFKKIQQILLNYAKTKGVPETFSGYSEIKSLDGVYSNNIGNIVNAFKKILNMKTPDDRITSDFIEQLR
jgi:undecaprenyl pyrophosphate synthase